MGNSSAKVPPLEENRREEEPAAPPKVFKSDGGELVRMSTVLKHMLDEKPEEFLCVSQEEFDALNSHRSLLHDIAEKVVDCKDHKAEAKELASTTEASKTLDLNIIDNGITAEMKQEIMSQLETVRDDMIFGVADELEHGLKDLKSDMGMKLNDELKVVDGIMNELSGLKTELMALKEELKGVRDVQNELKSAKNGEKESKDELKDVRDELRSLKNVTLDCVMAVFNEVREVKHELKNAQDAWNATSNSDGELKVVKDELINERKRTRDLFTLNPEYNEYKRWREDNTEAYSISSSTEGSPSLN